MDWPSRKLWQSPLTYNVAGGAGDLDAETAPFGQGPCVERKETLYVFDQGVLNAFDLATGNARWRAPATSIAGVHFDDKGMIYVNTCTESSDILNSKGHFDAPEDTALLVEKIDPKTGAVLWKVEREGLVRYASGQFLYTVASQRGDAEDEDFAMPLLNTGFQKIAHVRVKRLDPANGRVLWEHYHGHTPLDVAFEKNTIHLLCKKEMRVLKFFSF